jgi:hypothetical protein
LLYKINDKVLKLFKAFIAEDDLKSRSMQYCKIFMKHFQVAIKKIKILYIYAKYKLNQLAVWNVIQ